MKSFVTTGLVLLLISGCTWVKLTQRGEQVRMASSPAKVADCKKIGNTSVSLLDKVGYFKRSPEKVEDELSILGRNSAAEMGGDTILPVSEVNQGERSFDVYRCRGK